MCVKCGSALPESAIFRSSQCPDCGAPLKNCVNCIFYAPGRHYDCMETVSEPVIDKEEPNFCDSFRPKKGSFAKNDAKKAKARDDFSSLFGGG